MVGRRPLGSERTGSCCGVILQSVPFSPMHSCLVRPDGQAAVFPHPTMNSPSLADRLGRVYSLVEVSVSGVMVVLQILIGYRCSVDKARIQGLWMCVFFVYWQHVCTRQAYQLIPLMLRLLSPLPSPHPFGINYCRVDLLGLPTPTFVQRISKVVKRSSIIGPAVYCIVVSSGKFSMARNSMLDTEKFFQVSSLGESR